MDLARFLRETHDLETLAHIDFAATRMESSWDKTGGNQDGFDPSRLQNNAYVIADLRGPGVVRRFYSARPLGRLRIFVDGALEADMPAADFFSGRRYPFLQPLVGPNGGAFVSYFPIPFSRSLRMEILPVGQAGTHAYGFYYQVTYHSYPAGTPVQSFHLPLGPAARQELNRALTAWRCEFAAPAGKRDSVQIEPGGKAVLADLAGPAIIEQFGIKLLDPQPEVLRSALLKIRWDDAQQDAVDCPLGDFFGNAFGFTMYRSLALGLTAEGYYCRFAMPFARRGRISVVNEGVQRLAMEFYVRYRKLGGWDPSTGYFHAKWRREDVAAVNMGGHNLSGEYNYTVADLRGAGRYVGTNLNVFNRGLFWWGEGDPMIFLDGDSWPPALHGTGTEEYFNDAYGFHPGAGAISGVLSAGLAWPASCYGGNAIFAHHIADSLPFRERIRVTFEHGTENNRSKDYSSTAYWYALPRASDFFVMRPEAERRVIAQSRWASLRAERAAKILPALREDLREVVRKIRTRPTDAAVYQERMGSIWRSLMVPGENDLPNSERSSLQDLLTMSAGKPPAEQWRAVDQVLVELGRRIAGEPSQ